MNERTSRRTWSQAMPARLFQASLIALAAGCCAAAGAAEKQTATLEVNITAQGRSEPLPCRIQLLANGQPLYAPDCPRWERDQHFSCDGQFRLEAPAGKIELQIERGPEWRVHQESFELAPGETRKIKVVLARWIDMNARGWHSGDLHVHRPPADLPLLMRAEDLNVAPVLTHWNQRHSTIEPPFLRKASDPGASSTPRFYHTLCQEDERIGGAILVFNMREPILRDDAYRHWPTGLAYHRAALEQPGVHVEVEKPFWWEAPVHVALGRPASLGVVHNHFHRRGMMENEAWGRARDKQKYPGQRGFCEYTLDLYYRYLNLGWNLPASAGSASGVLSNPLGYNRVYVQLDKFDYDRWFKGLRAGRNFATNGPLIFATLDGQAPGAQIKVAAGQRYEGALKFEVLSRGAVDAVEVIVNGKVASTHRPAQDPKCIAASTRVTLESSGWIAVRAFEKHQPTLRFAHTSPFYVTVGGQPRRDPAAARFYVKWLDDLIARMKADRAKFKSEAHLAEVIATYKEARAKYAGLVD